MSIGIYKITNPNGKIYIGQSINIEKRFNSYKKYLRCKPQRKLFGSLKKYGSENHTFEIIEECDLMDLNIRERYWQDKYNSFNDGLNLILTSTIEKPQLISEDTKNKIRNSLNKYFENLSDDDKKEIYGKTSRNREV